MQIAERHRLPGGGGYVLKGVQDFTSVAAATAIPNNKVVMVDDLGATQIERWNGVPFVEPYKKVRDVVRFLRDALSGEKVATRYDTFEVQGFRLGIRPEHSPPILVAALREGMLRLDLANLLNRRQAVDEAKREMQTA